MCLNGSEQFKAINKFAVLEEEEEEKRWKVFVGNTCSVESKENVKTFIGTECCTKRGIISL